jgi:hypothetical protein
VIAGGAFLRHGEGITRCSGKEDREKRRRIYCQVPVQKQKQKQKEEIT